MGGEYGWYRWVNGWWGELILVYLFIYLLDASRIKYICNYIFNYVQATCSHFPRHACDMHALTFCAISKCGSYYYSVTEVTFLGKKFFCPKPVYIHERRVPSLLFPRVPCTTPIRCLQWFCRACRVETSDS